MKIMVSFFICIVGLCTSSHGLSKANDRWYSFQDSVTKQYGFKDNNGKIRIESSISQLARIFHFDNIITISEMPADTKTSSRKRFYLLKNGKRVGVDSVYVDGHNDFEIESEGFVRFHDRKNDKLGFLNRHGQVNIPAEYNQVARFRNGMAVALKNAKTVYHEGEHRDHEGGEWLLIDTNNNILIENYKKNDALDFYSLQILHKPSQDNLRINIKGTNGKYYSFINRIKHFKVWLSSFVQNLLVEKMIENAFPEILNRTKIEQSEEIIPIYFKQLKRGLQSIIKRHDNDRINIYEMQYYVENILKENRYYSDYIRDHKWMINPEIECTIQGELISLRFLYTGSGYKISAVDLSRFE